jgi:hypothetical protein
MNNVIFSSGGSNQHKELIQKLQASVKTNKKAIQRISKEFAEDLAEKFNACENPLPYYFLHKNNGVELDFANAFLRNAKPKAATFFFITISDGLDTKSGSVIIQGNAEDIAAVFDKICELLDAKGSGKNNRYQAKANKLNKVKECEALIVKHFERKSLNSSS